ncbi:uncharacterized protein RSE6_06327 [Rhynchosporium secalis]|uniref:DUF7779 domain-containing protein n=1 Tax=Rhynchosporium secalis TaxID=38038 RepID=A0A1E1MB74_RHYSE|nr:uncharacterized protein RSE6_06327 [Rhynchosporium secalis]
MNKKMMKVPFYFIPSRLTGRESKYFQSRKKEMDLIQSIMFSPGEELGPTAVLASSKFSLGGMGKTELALRFVQDAFAWYLGLMDSSDKNNHELCSETFRTWVADPAIGAPESREVKSSVKWLLVLDNAENAEVIDKIWPTGHHGNILVTTRNPILTPTLLYIKDKVQLSGLGVEDGANILKICARDDGSNITADEDAKVIVDWIEGLPMAIIQLGRTIYTKRTTISDFLRFYPTKADLYQHISLEDTSVHNLVTSWALIDLEEQRKEVFDLLCIIAMLDPEKIEQRTLEHQAGSISETSLTASRKYINIRAQLVDASLIDVDRRNGEVSVHRVVQEVAKIMMVRGGHASSVFNRAVDRMEAQWPFLNRNYVTGSDRWDEYRVAYLHIHHLMGVHAEFVERRVENLASFWQSCYSRPYRPECGVSHDAAILLDEVEKIYEQATTESATHCQDRGPLYIGLAVSSKNGDDLLQYVKLSWNLEIERHRNMGHATSWLAVAHNDTAVAWAWQGELKKSIIELKESRRVRENLPGFIPEKLFSPLYHFGIVYACQGKYDEVEKVLNETIGIWEEAFGPNDAGINEERSIVLRSWRSEDARIYAKLEEPRVASRILDEVLSNTLDKEPYQRDVARTAFLYTQCLKAMNKTVEADQWLARSLKIHNKLRPGFICIIATLIEGDIAMLIPYDSIG